MCGIAGTTSCRRIDSSKIFELMKHRGPDAHGVYEESIKLFHSRLAIIDLDRRSDQPMWSEDGSVGLIFNGEIYNFKQLKKRLEKKYIFKTSSDTEVILHGFMEWGNDIWPMLEGMFAVAVYDEKNKRVVLAKDHAGIKPLWYMCTNKGLSWSSELRTLAEIASQLNEPLRLDKDMIRFYLGLGYIPSPYSAYQNVFQLEASSCLEFNTETKQAKVTKYASKISMEDTLGESVEDSVLSHLEADVPVGLFFSGGMDSSLIAAILKKHNRNLKAYSLRIPGRNVDQQFSENVAKYLDLDISYFDFNQEVFNESYFDVTNNIDVPLADIALLSNSYISKQAAKDVKVVLSGEGGDELFFGYARQRYLHTSKSNAFWRNVLQLYVSAPVHKYKGYIFQSLAQNLDAPSYYTSVCSPFFNLVNKAVFNKVVKQFEGSNPIFYDRDFYLENMLLRKLDFVTMQFSLEGRVPLLSKKMFAESEKRCDYYLGREDEIKPELRKVLLNYLPKELVDRPKSGFGFRSENFIKNNVEVCNDFENAVEFMNTLNIHIPMSLYQKRPSSVLPIIFFHKSIQNVIGS